nr:DUF4973 domain-containing protein [Bacteroides thetaiotaomicron]
MNNMYRWDVLPVNDKGVTDIYVRYKQGGEVNSKLPMIVSGSIAANGKDRTVHIAVDTDTLDILNQARFGREDLYYVAMEDVRYSFPSTVNIPAGTFTTLLDITFKLDDIDLFKKWVLPLSIEDDPSYNYVGHPRKRIMLKLYYVYYLSMIIPVVIVQLRCRYTLKIETEI